MPASTKADIDMGTSAFGREADSPVLEVGEKKMTQSGPWRMLRRTYRFLSRFERMSVL